MSPGRSRKKAEIRGFLRGQLPPLIGRPARHGERGPYSGNSEEKQALGRLEEAFPPAPPLNLRVLDS